MVREKGAPGITVTKPEDLLPLLSGYYARHDREEVLAIYLNQQNVVVAIHSVSVGTLTASLVHPREVFKVALLCNAAAVMIVHNHPSGDPTPSDSDKAITKTLKQGGDLLGIRFLDHLIVGEGARFYSFSCEGKV